MTTATDHHATQALLDAIRSRRSFALNQLSPEPIDLAAIPLMLEAARWAPNHGLTEPWRFAVFAGDRRQALSDAFGAAYRQMTLEVRYDAAAEQGQRKRVWQAPVPRAVKAALGAHTSTDARRGSTTWAGWLAAHGA